MPLSLENKQEQIRHRYSALSAYQSGKRYVMRGDGYGTSSAQIPKMIARITKHLWAEKIWDMTQHTSISKFFKVLQSIYGQKRFGTPINGEVIFRTFLTKLK